MKVIAIASKGGHWIQLLRLIPALSGHEVIYISTNANLATMVANSEFYYVEDGDRDAKLKLLTTFYRILKIIYRLKPALVITTGSAPGLMGIIAGKLLGVNTIWIDSIANVEKISTSCHIATYFADRIYTQWPHLANSRIIFNGNILS